MLKRIHQHLFLIGTVLFGALAFFFLNRLAGDSPKVADIAGLVVCCALFCWTAIAGALEELERKLNKLLEAKMGGTSSGSVNSVEPCRSRRDLEHSLVAAMAPGLVCRMGGEQIGAYIKDAADAIMGSAQTGFMAKVRAHMAQAGAMADQAAEAEIVAAGLTAPRVTAEQIQALMDLLTWRYEQPEGTTSTFAHAFLGRFYLATGHSACVSPENFNADLGMKYAREQAEGKARDKLWELEGYKLFSSQVGAQAQ